MGEFAVWLVGWLVGWLVRWFVGYVRCEKHKFDFREIWHRR